ncbi:MAG: peptidylprolyl isomerase, partial [Clostridiales bacterium]|nr:peptidylprolyl isomerase [Clostridiales bacterium]
ELDDENITFDCNHEMAGKALNFTIEMLEIN